MARKFNPVWQPEREPNVIVESLLRDDWDSREFRYVDGRFETNWLHTGWYVESNPNPQVSVSLGDEGPDSETGWTGIDGAGRGPVAWMDGIVDVNIWVPSDEYPYDITGVNPKSLAWQLKQEVEHTISMYAGGTTYNGERELQRLGTGRVRPVPTEEGSPVAHRREIPIYYEWYKGRTGEP